MIGRANRSASTRSQGLQWAPIRFALMASRQHPEGFKATLFSIGAKSRNNTVSLEKRSWWQGTPQHRPCNSLGTTRWCHGYSSRVHFKTPAELGKRSCPALAFLSSPPLFKSAERISSLWFYIQRQQPSNLDRLQLFSFKQRSRLLYFSRASVLGLAC